MLFFSLESIKDAIKNLFAANTGQYFKTYLTLKHFGLSFAPQRPVVIDTTNTSPSVRRLFNVENLPQISGFEDKPFYNPLNNEALKEDISRSVVQTHVKRFHDGSQVLGKLDWLEIKQRDDKKWVVNFSQKYPIGLGSGKTGLAKDDDMQIAIPTPSFIAWYFRYEAFDEEPSLDSLLSRVKEEINLSEEELYLLFDKNRTWGSYPFVEQEIDKQELAIHIANLSSRGNELLSSTESKAYSLPQFKKLLGGFRTMTKETDWWKHEDIEKEALEILQQNRTLLIEGPPGVGKTRLAKKLAKKLVETENQIHLFQLHSSVSYEDLFEALVPEADKDGNIIFAPKPKRLLLAIEAAVETPQVAILDELNRADVSKVLGEAFQLLEIDYRGQEHGIPRIYDSEKLIWIPFDFYLIATMNDLDRSTFDIDFALRRRFGQIYLNPNPGALSEMLRSRGCSDEELIRTLASLLSQLQEFYPVGHAYFKDVASRDDLPKVYRRNIRPVVKNYLGDYSVDKLEAMDALVHQAYTSQSFSEFIGLGEDD